jgi:hypothetical protein
MRSKICLRRPVDWLLLHADPSHWTEFYCPGHHYGHITSNIAESVNSWQLDAYERPILAMSEQFRQQLTGWFNVRRLADVDTQGILVSKVAKEIQVLLQTRARRYRLLGARNDIFEIFSTETSENYIVNLQSRTCSCWAWQTSGIPCAHVLAVSLRLGADPQTYANSFFRLSGLPITVAPTKRPFFLRIPTLWMMYKASQHFSTAVKMMAMLFSLLAHVVHQVAQRKEEFEA